MTEVFRSEVCKGFNYKMVANALDKRGYLRREDSHFTIKTQVTLKFGTARVYCVLDSILSGEDSDA